jgi:hypothetical protein
MQLFLPSESFAHSKAKISYHRADGAFFVAVLRPTRHWNTLNWKGG